MMTGSRLADRLARMKAGEVPVAKPACDAVLQDGGGHRGPTATPVPEPARREELVVPVAPAVQAPPVVEEAPAEPARTPTPAPPAEALAEASEPKALVRPRTVDVEPEQVVGEEPVPPVAPAEASEPVAREEVEEPPALPPEIDWGAEFAAPEVPEPVTPPIEIGAEDVFPEGPVEREPVVETEAPIFEVGGTRVGEDAIGAGEPARAPAEAGKIDVDAVDSIVTAIGMRLGSRAIAEDIQSLVMAMLRNPSEPVRARPDPVDTDAIIAEVKARLLPEVEARVRRQVRETLDPFMARIQRMVDSIVDALEGPAPVEGEPQVDFGLRGQVASLDNEVGALRATVRGNANVLRTAFGPDHEGARVTRLENAQTVDFAVLGLVLSRDTGDVNLVASEDGRTMSIQDKVRQMAGNFGAKALYTSLGDMTQDRLRAAVLEHSNVTEADVQSQNMHAQITARVDRALKRIELCQSELSGIIRKRDDIRKGDD